MKIVGIIPARMAASRFPGKPLALINGYPMIEHVYRRAQRIPLIDEVYLATCDNEIYNVTIGFGGKAIMTSDSHVRGTDRVAEAASKLQADLVINVQGDEPLLNPNAVSSLCEVMTANHNLLCANLANIITEQTDFLNQNQIKVVCDMNGDALYMSRQPIPTTRSWGQTKVVRQLGIVGFKADFLRTFAKIEPTPLEQAESIDMLRALEHGYKVHMVLTDHQSFGVDTKEDLIAVEKRMTADPIFREIFGNRK